MLLRIYFSNPFYIFYCLLSYNYIFQAVFHFLQVLKTPFYKVNHQWLDTKGDSYFTSFEVSASVRALHERIHNLVEELLALNRKVKDKEIVQGIKALYALHDQFIKEIALDT